MTGLGRVRVSWWPLGAVSVVVPAGLIVAVVVVMTWPMLGWPYPLWVQTSAQFHQQFTWAGLVAGTAGCWYAVQFHVRDRIWVQPRAPRWGGPVVAGHLRVVVSWWLGAYLVGLVPVVAATVVAGGVGEPDVLVMVSGVAAMVAAVLLGYAVGTVTGSVVAVPVTAAGFYALLVAGHAGGDSYAVVAPVLYLEPELGQRESPALVVVRIAVFVAVAAAAAGLAARVVHRVAAGTPQRWRRLADVAVYGVVPAVLIAGTLFDRPAVFAVDERPGAVCEVRREIRYCVNQAHRPRLAGLIDRADPVIARYGATPRSVSQVWDQSLAFGPIEAEVARTVQIAFLNPDGSIEVDLPAALAGIYTCATDLPAGQDNSAQADSGQAVSEEVGDVRGDLLRFLTELDEPPGGVFTGMRASEVQRWIAEHQHQLHTCTLTPQQLPQP